MGTRQNLLYYVGGENMPNEKRRKIWFKIFFGIGLIGGVFAVAEGNIFWIVASVVLALYSGSQLNKLKKNE